MELANQELCASASPISNTLPGSPRTRFDLPPLSDTRLLSHLHTLRILMAVGKCDLRLAGSRLGPVS